MKALVFGFMLPHIVVWGLFGAFALWFYRVI
jgi:hypothetical protein